MHKLCFFTLMILFLSAFELIGQILPFENYLIKDGLPSSRVEELFQDSQGRLWIGTDNGLSVYDGISFKNYGVKDGLPLRYVICIIESQKQPGRFFIGTHGAGIAIFEDGTFQKTIRLGDGFAENIIQHLFEDNQENLWCQTAGGVFRISGKEIVNVLPKGGREGGPYIFQAPDGKIWMSLVGQCWRYDPESETLSEFNPGFQQEKITCKIEDADGTLWLGSNIGNVYKICDNRIVATSGKAKHYLRNVLDDGAGYLWFVTWKGIVKIEKSGFPAGEIIRYDIKNGLPDHNLHSCLRDREGNLWFGSVRKALIKLSNWNIYTFDRQSVQSQGISQPALLTANNHIFSSGDKGLWEIWKRKDGSWQRHLHQVDKIRSTGDWYTLAADQSQRLWVMVEGRGLYGFSVQPGKEGPSRLTLRHRLTQPVAIFQTEVTMMTIDAENQLWLSINDHGDRAHSRKGAVVQIDLETMTQQGYYTRKEGLPANRVTAISRHPDGNIWFGGFYGGISVFRPEGKRYVFDRKYDRTNGLSSEDISAISVLRNGEMWIGTRFNGVLVYKDGKFRTLTVQEGLYNEVVRAFAADEKENIWICTSAGVQSFAVNPNGHFRVDKNMPGLQLSTLRFLPGEEILFGEIWNRLSIYEYGKDRTRLTAIPVNIAQLRVNGKAIDTTKDPVCSFGEKLYEIDFIGVSLREEQGLRYECRLVRDAEIEWRSVTTERRMQYTSLHPGQYTFEVTAVKMDSVESPQPARFSFRVTPPLWQNGWFITLLVFITGLILYALHKFRLKRALEIEQIRARIATDLHDEIGAGLTHIGLLSEVAIRQGVHTAAGRVPAAVGPSMTDAMQRVGEVARDLSTAMSDVVWSINPKHDSVAALFRRLKAFANTICQAKGICLAIEAPERIYNLKLHPEVRRNLLLITKEALNNAVKYAESPTIEMRIETRGQALNIMIKDTGKGFDMAQKKESNGLINMRQRAKKLGGRCDIFSTVGKGTEVVATVPYRG